MQIPKFRQMAELEHENNQTSEQSCSSSNDLVIHVNGNGIEVELMA